MEEDLKDLLEKNGNLRKENHLLNDQVNSQINFKLPLKLNDYLYGNTYYITFVCADGEAAG
jgi:hypothetical protein